MDIETKAVYEGGKEASFNRSFPQGTAITISVLVEGKPTLIIEVFPEGKEAKVTKL